MTLTAADAGDMREVTRARAAIGVLSNAKGRIAVAMLLGQSLFKAGTVVLLAKLAAAGGSVPVIVLVYAGSIAVDLAWTALTEIAVAAWSMASLDCFLRNIVKGRVDRVDLYGSKANADQFMSATISPGQELVTNLVTYLTQVSRALGFASTLIFGLAGTVGWEIAVTLLLSATFAVGLSILAAVPIRRATSRRNAGRKRLTGQLRKV